MKKRKPLYYFLALIGFFLIFGFISISLSLSKDKITDEQGLATFNFYDFLGFDFGNNDNNGGFENPEGVGGVDVEIVKVCKCNLLDGAGPHRSCVEEIISDPEENGEGGAALNSNSRIDPKNEEPTTKQKRYRYCLDELGCYHEENVDDPNAPPSTPEDDEDDTDTPTERICSWVTIYIRTVEGGDCYTLETENEDQSSWKGGGDSEGICAEKKCKGKITDEYLVDISGSRSEGHKAGDKETWDKEGECYDQTKSRP